MEKEQKQDVKSKIRFKIGDEAETNQALQAIDSAESAKPTPNLKLQRLDVLGSALVLPCILSFFLWGLFQLIQLKIELTLTDVFHYFILFGRNAAGTSLLGAFTVLVSAFLLTKSKKLHPSAVIILCLASSFIVPSIIYWVSHLFGKGGLLYLLSTVKTFQGQILWMFVSNWLFGILLPSFFGGVVAMGVLIKKSGQKKRITLHSHV